MMREKISRCLSILHRRTRGSALMLTVAGASLFAAGAASAQTLVMATDSVGSMNNAIGAGMAKIVAEHSNQRIVIKTFAGPDAYMVDLNTGEFHFSIMSSMTAWSEYGGLEKRGKMSNLRLLRSGDGALLVTFVVPAKSNIHKIKDLKGQQVTYGYGGHAVLDLIMRGTLGTVGLTWDDVKKVPVTGVVDGIRALGSGRADATWGPYRMPALQEVNAQRGIRYLPIETTPEAKKYYYEKVFPGLRFRSLPADPKMGLPEPTTFLTYDTYLVAHKDTDGKAVREILKALWDDTDQLRKTHSGLEGFSLEAAVTDPPVIPYHPAAIEFYKSIGKWTPEVNAVNSKL